MREILFFAPSFLRYETEKISSNGYSFPALSLTGERCELKCNHCKGFLLKRMLNADSPQKLWDLATRLKGEGAQGLLISGGSNIYGEVEFEPFAETIERIKKTLNLKVVIHSGVLNSERTHILESCGVDAVMIDIPPSDEVAQRVFHLQDRKVFFKTLEYLSNSKLRFFPHIICGFNPHSLKDETETCEYVGKTFNPDGMVAIFLTGIRGTEYEGITTPSLDECYRFLYSMREHSRRALLGCKRPGGEFSLMIEKMAVELNFDGIVFPREETVREVEDKFSIKIFHTCCTAI